MCFMGHVAEERSNNGSRHQKGWETLLYRVSRHVFVHIHDNIKPPT